MFVGMSLGDRIRTKERLEPGGPIINCTYVLIHNRWGYSFFNRDKCVHLFEPVESIPSVLLTLNELRRSDEKFWFVDWEFDI